MKILHILFSVFAILMSLFTISLSCFPSKITSFEEGNFVVSRKYLDDTYIKQFKRLERCLIDFDQATLLLIDMNKSIYIDQAVTSVYNTLAPHERREFRTLNYKRCFEDIADLNAKKFICVTFRTMLGEEDMLLKYALEEYEACIRSRGGVHGKTLNFDMPQIGPANS